MCCKGSEIKYKDYTPQDQLSLRQATTGSMIDPATGKLRQATPLPPGSPLVAPMNNMYEAAMQAMMGASNNPNYQWQQPNYMSFQQFGQQYGQPQPPAQASFPSMGGMGGMGGGGGFQGMGGMGGGMQGRAGGGMGGQVPFWLMMPGMGGGMPQGGGKPPQ